MEFKEFEAAVRKNIPEECGVSVEHAQVHFTEAQEDIRGGDTEQASHNLNIAGCIMLALSWDI